MASRKPLEIRAVSGSVHPGPDPYKNVTNPELWFSRFTHYTQFYIVKYSSLPIVTVEEHGVQHAADVPQVTEKAVFIPAPENFDINLQNLA